MLNMMFSQFPHHNIIYPNCAFLYLLRKSLNSYQILSKYKRNFGQSPKGEIVCAAKPTRNLGFGFIGFFRQFALRHTSLFEYTVDFFGDRIREAQLRLQFRRGFVNDLPKQFPSFRVLFHKIGKSTKVFQRFTL